MIYIQSVHNKSRLLIIMLAKLSFLEAKSRKFQGVFEVKSRVKTWQVRGIKMLSMLSSNL